MSVTRILKKRGVNVFAPDLLITDAKLKKS